MAGTKNRLKDWIMLEKKLLITRISWDKIITLKRVDIKLRSLVGREPIETTREIGFEKTKIITAKKANETKTVFKVLDASPHA